jgi:hypothetical protein
MAASSASTSSKLPAAPWHGLISALVFVSRELRIMSGQNMDKALLGMLWATLGRNFLEIYQSGKNTTGGKYKILQRLCDIKFFQEISSGIPNYESTMK